MIEVVLIGGPMKTGSSALARGFTELSRSGLLPPGLYYPVDEQWEPAFAGNHIQKHHLLMELAKPREAQKKARLDLLDLLLTALAEDIRSTDSPDVTQRVVFIAEGAANRLARDSEEIRALTVHLRKYFDSVRLVFMVREQVAALRSRANQLVRSLNRAHTLSHVCFRGRVVRPESRFAQAYDYSRLSESLKSIGLHDSTYWVIYDEKIKGEPDLFARVLREIGPYRVDLSRAGLNEGLIHGSVSPGVFLFLGTCNEVARLAPILSKPVLAIRQWVHESALRRTHRPRRKSILEKMWSIFTKKPEASIRSHFRESNQIFAQSLHGNQEFGWLEAYRGASVVSPARS